MVEEQPSAPGLHPSGRPAPGLFPTAEELAADGHSLGEFMEALISSVVGPAPPRPPEYTISMVCVDDSHIEISARDPKRVLNWLRENDHEGSDIVLRVVWDGDPERIYDWLKLEAMSAELAASG